MREKQQMYLLKKEEQHTDTMTPGPSRARALPWETISRGLSAEKIFQFLLFKMAHSDV